MQLRDATWDDLPGVLAIYNDIIATTAAVWRDDPVDLAERQVWLEARRGDGFPVLVATEDGAVAGFASYGPWRAAPGYAATVEHTVHVEGAHRGRGVGRALVEALVDRARAQGMHAMIGGIEAGNAASLALHARLGFERVAQVREVGRKFDRWLDLIFVERLL